MKANNFRAILSILILVIVLCAYSYLVAPFYLGRAYEVPDYFKFYGFAKDGLPSQDGFSTLFIAISSQLIEHYEFIHWGSLALVMGALLIIQMAFFSVSKNWVLRICFLLFVFSMGCWYYLYGKVFYEFPFIAFTFAVLLFNARKSLLPGSAHHQENADGTFNKLYPPVFAVLAGFCVSWKPHAIFPVMGLMGLMLINQKDGLQIKFKSMLIVAAFMAAGFFMGNFGVFENPISTAQGIRGYKSGANVWNFLLSDQNSTWDHTNVLSFDSAVYKIGGSIFILFLTPFFTAKAKDLLALNIGLLALFLLVVNKFLPGYPHNAFPFSLYFIALVFYTLLHIKQSMRLRYQVYCFVLMCFALLQSYWVFLTYLPLQRSWANITNQSIEGLKLNSPLIYERVKGIIDAHGPNYRMNVKIKRNSPKGFANPLEAADLEIWEPIFARVCLKPCNAQYQIYIEPLAMRSIPNFESEKDPLERWIVNGQYEVGVKGSADKLIDQYFDFLH